MIVDINNPECDVKKLFDDFSQYMAGIASDKIWPHKSTSVEIWPYKLISFESFELNNVINWMNSHNGNHKDDWMNVYEAQKLCDTWIVCKFITKSICLCSGLGLERFDIAVSNIVSP